MNTYAITLGDYTYNAFGQTSGKAKYKLYRDREFGDFMSFGEFVKFAQCRLRHKFHVQDLFTQNIDSFNRMKVQRDIEFTHLGMRVEVAGKLGVIVGSNSSLNLDVCFDGEHWASNCHPWWKVKYFDNRGTVIREYGD